MAAKTEQEREEAVRLKTLAEKKYGSSNLKSAIKYAKRAHRLFPNLDGLSEMLTAFKILRVAAKLSSSSSAPADDSDTDSAVGGGSATLDWYKILQIEPFSHINTIKKQYKRLALTLHPDKNPFPASEEAFKLVGEAFRVLSDKIRRKEYDMKLRISMQSAATDGGGGGGGVEEAVETFWTACSTCRLLHKFERKYLGHNLMCPSCKKSFTAVEVSENIEGDGVGTRSSARIRVRVGVFESLVSAKSKRKMSTVGEVLERSRPKQRTKIVDSNGDLRSERVDRSRIADNNKIEGRAGGLEVPEKSKLKRKRSGEETMTLAELQALAKRKVNWEETKLRSKEKLREEKCKESERVKEKKGRDSAQKSGNLEIKKHTRELISGDFEKMVVDDSDFYDFDKDRMERSFKKGQVWAIYDDDDGMPRYYGLIDEIVSVNPFVVKMSWLDLQSNGDEGLISWEKMGIHISCGRFRVARKTSIDSVNVYSHLVDAERAAREVYRIYPKKGSVWALYKEDALDNKGRNLLVRDKRCYDIVVFLTSYSEIHGLSMAYLEKVDGFRAVFKRKEIGCHAIRWLEKDDVRLFSHQIPARKLSGEEDPDLSKDCWELDPASLPPELLTIDWHK
ncbi:DNAJ heat shock N-terminal domain-containing protein [Actinidia rufa]|uniref:DNAJ heat shock N-terminal domain-containing protein n=1 Tax=Actinidia rufa TaxID=165716 RepID=A0A7J0GD20_9ERIC|nr:DNAJ heat shock N-terminal domain-containing protein [Actinidia rufa]